MRDVLRGRSSVPSSRSYLNRQLPAVFRIVCEHARTRTRNKISNADRMHSRRTVVPENEMLF